MIDVMETAYEILSLAATELQGNQYQPLLLVLAEAVVAEDRTVLEIMSDHADYIVGLAAADCLRALRAAEGIQVW